jgi:hypothetical protein
MSPRPCQCADGKCFREATLVARVMGNGDRPMARECFDSYVAMGLVIRELPAETFVPLWRQKSLARDTTGRVLTIRGAA